MTSGSNWNLAEDDLATLQVLEGPDQFAEFEEIADRRQLSIQTLKDLKLPDPEAARALGFVCVRPGKTVDYCRRPGLWVKPGQVSLLCEVLAAFRQAQQTRYLKQQKTAQAAQGQLLANLQATVGVSDWAQLPPSAQALVRQELAKLPTWQELTDRLAEAAYAQDPTRWEASLQKKPRGWRVFFSTVFHGHPVRARGYCSSALLLRPLLLNQPETLTQALLPDWHDIEARAEALWLQWSPTRPAWFSAPALAEWVVQAAEAPPLSGGYDPYTNPLYYQVPQSMRNACRKGKRFELQLLVPNGQAPATIRLSIPLSEQLDAAWHVPAATLEFALLGAQGHLQNEKLARIHQIVDSALNRQEPATLGLTPNEWRAMGWSSALVAASAGVWREADLADQLERTVQDTAKAQKARFLAQQCQTQLPPHLKDCYPLARGLGRRLTLIIGAPNSGKTHRALKALQEAPKGVYLAPLRLLAQETRDRLLAAGVPTSLVTGEWVDLVSPAQHVAATVEMADLSTVVDVGVLDEVQLLADPERGPAWLRAFLGLPARELFLIGPPEIKEAVTALAMCLSEPLDVIEVQRLAPLYLKSQPTALADLKPGSAVIAFTRQEVLDLAAVLRTTYGRQPAVLYGALSPEVRREQARLFNSGEADVLVATDVIGMGLNLPIQELIFASTEKWDGKAWVSLTPEQARQIAGRAGRYGMAEKGEVGALDGQVLKEVRRLLHAPRASVQPEYLYSLDWSTLSLVADQLNTRTLGTIFDFFERQPLFDVATGLRPVLTETQKRLAAYLDEKTQFPLDDKFVLCFAPVAWQGGQRWSGDFAQFIKALTEAKPVRLAHTPRLQAAGYQTNLAETEALLQRLTLYAWLHYRFPEMFPDVREAQQQAALANATLGELLSRAGPRRCAQCGTRLGWRHPHPTCEACHREKRWRTD